MASYKRARTGTRSNPIVIGASTGRGWKKLPSKTYRKPRLSFRSIRPAEPKYIDTPMLALTDISGNAALSSSSIPLNLVPTGTGPSARVGRYAYMTGMTFDWDVYFQRVVNAGGVMGLANEISIFLVYSKIKTTTGPAWTDLLVAQDTHSLRNPDHTQEFKVLKKWNLSIPAVDNPNAGLLGNTATPYNQKKRVNGFIKLNLPILFRAASTTPIVMADVEDGLLQVYAVTDLGSSPNYSQFIYGNTRIHYRDQ